MMPSSPSPFAADLLHWYDRNARVLPWRTPPGSRVQPDPYRIWLSEIMLQQTTVASVKSYFASFTDRWPSVAALADAPLEAILAAWAGLGYYARARNLHACAQSVSRQHGGIFPKQEADLRTLPGVGAYTAAAIAAIAFNQPAIVVDGNVERVLSRVARLETPLPTSRPHIRRLAAERTPAQRPGDYAQAMMDLGSGLCTPRNPLCGLCPVARHCASAHREDAAQFPRKMPKTPKPTRHGHVYYLQNQTGAVYVEQRPPKGLLGGLWAFPTSAWEEAGAPPILFPQNSDNWQQLAPLVRHTFTHFHLILTVWRGIATASTPQGQWTPPDKLPTLGLPTLMRKVATIALANAP